MTPQEKARQLRPIIEKAAESLPDEDALEAVELFPIWEPDTEYTTGERVSYTDKLYRCVQSHTSQKDWTPDVTPALWAEVAKPGKIPVWKQPTGAQDAFMKGDKVWFPEEDTTVYISTVDNNVWSPDTYGWDLA